MTSTTSNKAASLRGHYSLIQFCPDAARLEVANIGMALFCAEREYFGIKLSTDHRRITHMIGRGGRDIVRLRTSKNALEEKLCDTKHNLEDLQKLASLQVNQIRMTSYMPCRLTQSPADHLQQLFREMVNADSATTTRAVKFFPSFGCILCLSSNRR